MGSEACRQVDSNWPIVLRVLAGVVVAVPFAVVMDIDAPEIAGHIEAGKIGDAVHNVGVEEHDSDTAKVH